MKERIRFLYDGSWTQWFDRDADFSFILKLRITVVEI